MSLFSDLLGTVRNAFSIGIRTDKVNLKAASGVLTVANAADAPTDIVVADIAAVDINATGNVTGTWVGTAVAIEHGGTGQITKTDAFDALSPQSQKGDLIVHDGTDAVALAAGTDGLVLTADSASPTGLSWIAASDSGGTVTSVSVVTANGFTGTVANSTTAAAITLTTNVTGLVKGDGTSLSAAVAGTDYLDVLTGDVTTAGDVATLATVNANVGTFGSAANVGTFTVNGKGLITAASSTAIQIAETQITDGALLARNAGNETITGTWTFNNPVTGVTPVSGSQLTTKDYVDNAIAGLSWKKPVVAATTGVNVALDNTTTSLDTVTLADGDRVLVKDQDDATENGVYVVSTTGAWTRATDFDSASPIDEVNSAAVFVSQGATQADTGWTQVDTVVTVGADPMNFVQFNGASGISAGDGLAKLGNVLSVVTADSANITVGPGGINLATVTDGGTGDFLKFTIDSVGRVTGTTPVVVGDISALTDALYLPLTGGTVSGNLVVTGTVNGGTLSGNNSGDQTITLTGDVTGSGTGSFAATVAAHAVTNGKLAQMAAHTYKGNNTGTTADAIDVTATQLTADLNVFTTTLQGLAPASGGGTTSFLRADGTWADPAASTGGSRWTVESIDFTFGTGGTSTVNLPNAAVVHDVQVIVDTVFDGDPVVSVSTSAQTFATTTDIALQGLPVATVTEIHPGLKASTSSLPITVAVTSAGTAGVGRVLVTYASPL